MNTRQLRLKRIDRAVAGAAAALGLACLAGCAAYPYQQGSYGYPQGGLVQPQPAYPGGSYAPPYDYGVLPGYVQPAYPNSGYLQPGYPDTYTVQPDYAVPYGYAPGISGGVLIYGGGGGHRNDGRRDDGHRDWHGGDRAQPGNPARTGGWRGAPGRDANRNGGLYRNPGVRTPGAGGDGRPASMRGPGGGAPASAHGGPMPGRAAQPAQARSPGAPHVRD